MERRSPNKTGKLLKHFKNHNGRITLSERSKKDFPSTAYVVRLDDHKNVIWWPKKFKDSALEIYNREKRKLENVL